MDKIRVLFLAASPKVSPLSLDQEIREITTKIRAAEHRDSLEVISRWAVRPDDLQQALLEHRPHVLHFSGHGNESEELVLLDGKGDPKPVSKEALVHLLGVLKDNLRLIVLNACFSRPQAEAITQVIDCAVGMNRAVGDEAAIRFAAAFYRAVGFGRSIQTAFDLGRSALMLDDIPEAATPELVSRAGVDPASIVLIQPEKPRHDVEPPADTRGGSGKALDLWRQKLAFFEEQEAIVSDPAQKFALRKQIEEATAKITQNTHQQTRKINEEQADDDANTVTKADDTPNSVAIFHDATTDVVRDNVRQQNDIYISVKALGVVNGLKVSIERIIPLTHKHKHAPQLARLQGALLSVGNNVADGINLQDGERLRLRLIHASSTPGNVGLMSIAPGANVARIPTGRYEVTLSATGSNINGHTKTFVISKGSKHAVLFRAKRSGATDA